MKHRVTYLLAVIVLSSAGTGLLQGQEAKPAGVRETIEVFHVSRVGRTNFAESREQLIDFYREIEAEFNAEEKRKFQEQKKAFAGARVRVLEDLKKQENGQPLYLVAYQGKPSVFVISGNASIQEGALTIPLEVSEAGTYETKVTRVVVEKTEESRSPSLETASSGGGATFFGIPIGGSSSAPAEEESSGGKVKRTKVTEVRTLPKFEARPSEVTLSDPPVFSKELFLSAVQNGELYELQRQEERRCQNCGGFKRVQTNLPVGQRAADGKMACPECQEKGTVPWNVTYRVTW